MKSELDVLAVMLLAEQPNTKQIGIAAGMSEREVQDVIKSLTSDLGMDISRVRSENSSYYVIKSWGVFESGDTLKRQLRQRVLPNGKVLASTVEHAKPVLLTSFSEKHRYFEKVKIANFKESMRLEGLSVDVTHFPTEKTAISEMRTALIEKYSAYKGVD